MRAMSNCFGQWLRGFLYIHTASIQGYFGLK